MKAEIEDLKDKLLTELAAVSSPAELEELEGKALGRKGEVTLRLRALREQPPELRPELGQRLNAVKEAFQRALALKQAELAAAASESKIDFDLSLPGIQERRGSLHPVTQMTYELNEAFLSLGFAVYEGPEISSEAMEFDNLNVPPDHPARESMDTYWLESFAQERGAKRLCLRPHLTGASVRYMLSHQPPFRFVYPGRVYRNESTDAGHERAFNQYEALIVDRKVPFSAGKLLINTILERVFARSIKTRMRTGFFSFVEPGFEIDMQCLVCEGRGCSICKRVGWLEMMPGGPPHPNVFRAGGLDPREWQGFYLNIGLDRLVMMKHGIEDIRWLHSADLRFLRQFS